MEIGAIMMQVMLYNNVSSPIKQLQRIYDDMNDALIYAEGYFDVIDDVIWEKYPPEDPGDAAAPRSILANYVNELRIGENFVLNVYEQLPDKTENAESVTRLFEGVGDRLKFKIRVSY